MYRFGGKLFAALGTDWSGPSLVMSSDGGLSWYSAGVESPARFYTLFELDNQLSASPDLRDTSPVYSLYRFEGTSFQPTWPKSGGFPHARSPALRVTRPTNFQDQLVYIAGIPVNDHQWVPAGLYRAQRFGKATPIRLPNQARARDIIVHTGRCYVLGEIKQAEGYTIRVSESPDLVHWREMVRFQADTFARSFEMLNGDVYFGLGCETAAPRPASTGTILRIRQAHFLKQTK